MKRLEGSGALGCLRCLTFVVVGRARTDCRLSGATCRSQAGATCFSWARTGAHCWKQSHLQASCCVNLRRYLLHGITFWSSHHHRTYLLQLLSWIYYRWRPRRHCCGCHPSSTSRGADYHHGSALAGDFGHQQASVAFWVG